MKYFEKNTFLRIKQIKARVSKPIKWCKNNRQFRSDLKTFISQNKSRVDMPLLKEEIRGYLNDKTGQTPFDRHYIYHPAWAARILAKTAPKEHVDISSTLHFCTIISAFVPVKFYDFRPAKLKLNGLSCLAADLCDLPFEDNSISSLSCMHTVEHVGLGRYGDPIEADGDLKAISELKRVLASGGSLLFVVPVGKPRVVFNAHRIYSFEQIISYFSDLKLEDFALIPDSPKDGDLIVGADPKMVAKQLYGCGCFWFVKP